MRGKLAKQLRNQVKIVGAVNNPNTKEYKRTQQGNIVCSDPASTYYKYLKRQYRLWRRNHGK